jgi:hypothetical protein
MTRLAPFVATAAAVLSTGAGAGVARAQANYASAPIGGRSALMGGTGTALARDGSAPFLNPATIVHIDDSGVAFSVNFYTAQWTDLQGFHQPGLSGASRYGTLSLPSTSLDSSGAQALPSTLCLFLTIGHWGDNVTEKEPAPGHRKGRRKFAACLGTPEREGIGATAVGYSGTSGALSASQAASVQRSWNRIYVGPAYSVYVSDRVALGASLNGIGTVAGSTWSVDTLVHQGTGPGSALSYDTAMSAYSIDLGAMLGLVWHIDDVHVFGASISTPTAHLFGNYNATSSLQSAGAGSSAVLSTSSGTFSAPVPIRLGVGFGAEMRRLRIEGDASAYVPVMNLERADAQTQQTTTSSMGTTATSLTTSLQVDGRPIVDAALGLEYFLSRSFSLLMGARTDFSAADPLSSSPPIGTLAETRVQRIATSFGIGSYGDGSELLLGTELSYAWGKSIAVDPYVQPAQLALVDQRTFGAMLVIAGGASLSAFRRTLQDLGNVVRFPPQK